MDFIPFDLACFSSLKERFQYLFEEELINEICRYGQQKHFEEDEILIDIGEKITFMPLVLEGSIKIMTEDADGQELLLYYLELGDTCAVTLNCCTKKSKSTIRAISETHTEILFIPIEKMDEWMVKYPTWRRYVLDSYNERLNEMLASIDTIVFHSMEERILKYLKDKALITRNKKLEIAHSDIANDLHTSRVVVSRIMKKLEKQGELKQARGSVTLL